MSIWPGLAIMLVVLGFNFLGDGLRDILDPRIGGGVANLAAPKTAASDVSVLDLLVRDGAGRRRHAARAPFRGDVAVEGGRIAAVGERRRRAAPSA